MHATRAGAPAREALAEITKYDGNKKDPQWTDIQPSTAFDSTMTFVHATHDPTGKFETLCHVVADLSGAPCTLERGIFGKMCYTREYDVVLLVGLTELKAQIRWIDSVTVRLH